jgi:endo-1,4-beta-xylanase
VLIDECGVLVPENELKWYVLRPDAKTFAFERADRIAAFAKAHDIALRGHTLLWHHPRWFPAWLNDHDFGKGPAAAAKAQAMLVEPHRQGRRHYPQIDSWDVVNETIDPKDGSIRRTVFSDAMGQERPWTSPSRRPAPSRPRPGWSITTTWAGRPATRRTAPAC